ncbi:mechanosensitive ion channel domain-containing protein [Planctomycetota bacterium]
MKNTLLKLAGCFLLVNSAWAQGSSPEKLSSGELITRAQAAIEELTTLEAKAMADFDAFVSSKADLERAITDVQKPLPPYPLRLDELNTTDVNYVNAQFRIAETYGKAWEQRRVRHEAAAQALVRLETLRNDLNQNYGPWLDQAEALRPLLIEAQRRIARRDVTVADFELPEDSLSIADWIIKSGEWVSQRDESLAKFEAMIERLEEDRKVFESLVVDDPEQARAVKRIEIGLGVLAEADAVATKQRELLTNIREEALPTEVDRAVKEFSARATDLELAAEKVATQREAFQDVVAKREALQTPRREDIEWAPAIEAIRAARLDVELAKRMIAYYEQDLAFQQDLREKAEGLMQTIEETAARHMAFTNQVARVWAILKHIETMNEIHAEMSLSEVWDSWRAAQLKAFERYELNERLAVLLADESALEADQTLLAKERDNLSHAEAQLQTEISYAEFMKETEGLTKEELLVALGPKGEITTRLNTLQAEMSELQDDITAEAQQCLTAVRAIQILENPFSLEALRNHIDKFVEQREQIEALKEGQVPPDINEVLVSPVEADKQSLPDELQEGTTLMPVELAHKESEFLSREQQFARVFLGYYTDLETYMNTLQTSLEKRRQLDVAYEDRINQLIQTEKRRYAAALQLNQYIQSDPLSPGQEPNGLNLWLNRSTLHAADEQLRNTRKANTQFYERATLDIERLQALTCAQDWIKVRSDACNERVRLVGRPVSLLTSALTPLEELEEVDRQNLIYDAQEMQANEDRFGTNLLLPFSPAAEKERYLSPMNTYYVELANTDRVISDLEAADQAYKLMAAACVKEKEALLSQGPVFQETLARRVLDYHIARYVVAVAKYPGQRARIEDQFRKTYGRNLPYRLGFQAGDVKEAISTLVSAEARLIGARRLVVKTEMLLSKVGLDQEIGWYGMQNARIASLLQGQESHKEVLRENIVRLRTSYEKHLKARALRGLGFVLAIPIIAFVMVRILRRLIGRIEGGMIRARGGVSMDRQRRVQTLTKTSTAAISVIIWILAFIYTFAQLGLDITPIIASASVMGFALAFGAQTLVKDFFSGFFILIENQFTIGDIVALGDVSGTVEHISLRITVLRDLKGVVHYIPNGSIRQVSNKTQGWSRVVMEISVSYQEDPDKATRILNEVLQEMAQDEACAKNIIEEPSVAGVENLTERSVDIRIMIKTPPGQQWAVAREARRRIKRRFDEEGVSIPFPHRVIHHVYEDKDKPEEK